MTKTERLDLEPERANSPASAAVPLRGILFGDHDAAPATAEPRCFGDLNLDQVVEAVVAGRDDYELRPFFYAPLTEVEAVEYRHGCFAIWRSRTFAPPCRHLQRRCSRSAAT